MRLTRVHLARCGSTSVVATAWVRAGGRLPLVVSAETQTGGRGQWGRRWQSPCGGCWFTLAVAGHGGVREEDAAATGLPLRAAEAVAAGIHDAAGRLGVRVVEPNDLLIGDLKVGGILCERMAGRCVPATLIGVGLNAGEPPAGHDPRSGEPLRRPAGSLAAAAGCPVAVASLRHACVTRLLAALVGGSATPPAAQPTGGSSSPTV